jgi:cysteinyl-tRNA synthetase
MEAEPYRKQFIKAMDDDFNSAQALATLFDLAHDINRLNEARHGVAQAKQVLIELSGILGLNFGEPPIPPLDAKILADSLKAIYEDIDLKLKSVEPAAYSQVQSTYEKAKKSAGIVYELTRTSTDEDLVKANLIGDIAIQEAINLRQAFRASKLYELADEIRNRLGMIGIALEDTPKGTIWKRKR